MEVYADILFIYNSAVDYLILSLCAKILGIEYKTIRMLLGSVLGGISSMIIFLSSLKAILNIILQIIFSAFIIFVSFKFYSLKAYFRALAMFYVITYIYGGAMIGIWLLFKPQGMIVNNSVAYFNISPLYFLCFTVAFYLIISVTRSLLKRKFIAAQHCKITIFLHNKCAYAVGIFDTGNSLKDNFWNSQIIIVSNRVISSLNIDFNKLNDDLLSRFRLIPCQTIYGSGILNAIRCDKAIIEINGKYVELKNPIIAESNELKNSENNCILNPEILL